MNSEVETKMNENLECLLEHAFPKGDKRRGDALVLVAQAQIEIDKARQQGIEIGLKRCITCKAEQYKQGREAERKRIIEIIKSVIYEKFEEAGFYKYYSDEVIKSILSHLKNPGAKGK